MATQNRSAGTVRALPTPTSSIGSDWVPEWQLALSSTVSPKTIEVYLRAVGSFLDWLDREHPGITDPTEVTRHHVEGWQAARTEEGLSPATRSTQLKALSRFFDYVLDDETVPNPCRKVSRPKVVAPLVDVPTDEQVRALLKACEGKGLTDRRDLALLRVLADAGLRRAEAISLDLEDLDLANRAITVRKGKGSRPRLVSVGDKTALALSRWLRARKASTYADSPAVFVSTRGARLTGDGVYRIMQRRCAQVGLPLIHPHQLRHHATHALLAAGLPDQAVEMQMGWTGGQMVRRYASALAQQRALDLIGQAKVGDRL